MATAAERSREVQLEFGEKSFYLDEFRARTLCFAAFLAECERGPGLDTLARVARELIGNQSRVVLLIGLPGGSATAAADRNRLRRELGQVILCEETAKLFAQVRGRPSLAEVMIDFGAGALAEDLDELLVQAWSILRRRPLLVGLVPAPALTDFAEGFAGRLRVHKLVIAERAGGIASPSAGQISFMDEAMLTAILRAGEAEWAGLASRRPTLEAIRSALRRGVRTVNLCAPAGIERELYTYEGSGTLFTSADYCRVERLGIDDFEEVERLLARGQREGYLKPRSPAEMSRILVNGFGATIGEHHLAGACGLETETYADERAGEIVGLYTITRFKSEGVGRRLVDRVLIEARDMGLRYVFACTVDPRAQAFFERQGFRSVGVEEVPAAKWVGYDASRLDRLRIYRHDIVPDARKG